MMDIETLGKGPGFAVLSLAIVPFNLNGKPLDEDTIPVFESGISIADSLALGFDVDPETLQWWQNNDPAVIRSEFSHTTTVTEFCAQLINYMAQVRAKHKTYRIWASAPKLDFGCIYYLFQKLNRTHEWPILYSSERCQRTLRDLATTLDDQVEGSIKLKLSVNHNPTQDCDVQIIRSQAYYRAMRNLSNPLTEQETVDLREGKII